MEYVKIGDICTKVCSGGTPSSGNPSYYEGGSIPWLNTNEVNFCRIYSTEKKITQLGYENSAAKYIDENSVIVAMYGVTAGKSAIAKIRLTTNQACCNLSIDGKKADYEYVYYYLKLQSETLNKLANGGAQQNLNSKIIKDFKIPLPPLAIQHRIASILSAYDSQIENNQRRIKLLEQMAENLYKEWFVRFRFPDYENAEFEGGMPKGWTRCKLGDLIDFQNGFAFKSETFVPEGKYKVITIKNVQDGQFDSSNADRVEDIPKGMPSYCKLSEGDILLSLTGNVGRVCHVIGDNMLLNQRVAKIKSSHSHFAYCMLRTPAMFAYLNMIAYGTAQLNLSPIKAANLKIIKPTESIMEAFDKVVAPLFSSVFNLYNQIDFLSSQRDLLLPRLISGKLSI